MSLPRILMIEDNDADIMLLQIVLTKELGEHRFEVIPDGQAAIEFIRLHRNGMHEPHPCVIVLDLHLPRHDGLTVLQEVKQAPALNHIHVVVLSSMATPAQQEQIDALGAYFREKPSNLDAFESLAGFIRELCHKSLSATASSEYQS
ncbi:MAG: response regulator [Acidobacteriota bacterium]